MFPNNCKEVMSVLGTQKEVYSTFTRQYLGLKSVRTLVSPFLCLPQIATMLLSLCFLPGYHPFFLSVFLMLGSLQELKYSISL